MRSICDYDCVWTYKVIARTNATITIKLLGKNEEYKHRINKRTSEYRKAESVYPLGNYSMCPILSADHELSLQA